MKDLDIKKIVITGGPCAGKSTALDLIRDKFILKGYNVLMISETATEIINSGINPSTMRDNFSFQSQILKLQIEKEKIFDSALQNLKDNKKVLVVCDRGILDSKAYLGESDFQKVLNTYNLKENQVINNYDAVFHLVTSANGATEFYGLDNNPARLENIEQALELDNKLINAWSNHPHHIIVDNSTNFDVKLKRLLDEIDVFLN